MLCMLGQLNCRSSFFFQFAHFSSGSKFNVAFKSNVAFKVSMTYGKRKKQNSGGGCSKLCAMKTTT